MEENKKLKQQLIKEIDTIWKIVVNGEEHLLIANYLYNAPTKEEREYIQRSPYLQLIRQALLNIAILEYSKLYAGEKEDNEKYRVVKLFNKLKKDGYYRRLKFKQSLIVENESIFIESQEVIRKIKLIRHTVIAHTDSTDIILETVTWEELLKLSKIAKFLIKQIHKEIFEGEALVDEPVLFTQASFHIIRDLVEFDKIRIERILKK